MKIIITVHCASHLVSDINIPIQDKELSYLEDSTSTLSTKADGLTTTDNCLTLTDCLLGQNFDVDTYK